MLQVIEMWECTFNLEKVQNVELKRFLDTHDNPDDDPLNPRDAFFGGRTNCTKLFYEGKENEQIRYLDVCSLYPWACKYGKFPVGHPAILVGEDCPQDLTNVEGIVKATVLPPEQLYHPVLPVRLHGKLLFPLCSRCGVDQNNDDCDHNNDVRAITGTWVSDELKLAVSKGYVIKRIHEIWNYETTEYDGRDGGLFVSYINKFLKLKQEASDWPGWVHTEEDKNKYIDDFEQKEGVRLDRNSIRKNPGFRSISKMMLNSFWGKFGQRNNLTKTTFINKKEDLTSMLTNPNIEVNDITPINDEVMLTSWRDVKDATTPASFTSVVIAAYVTAIARIKLYSYLDMIGERVLYFDTDSIIFVEKPGLPSPLTGDFLGDLTDELSEYGDGSYIDTFVSGGPKNYAYRVRVKGTSQTKTVCKVKGINLNHNNSKIINFDKLKTMVLNPVPTKVVLRGTKIARTNRMDVVTIPDKKTYRVVYTKRRRVEEFDTLPYGYKKARL